MSALAQTRSDPLSDPDLAKLKTDFEYGKYDEVLRGATDRINRGNLTEEQLVEAHKYAGLSAFYLKRMPEARRHLVALIQLNPDYDLDPFTVPPPALAFFNELRKERAGELEMIRAERRLRAERLRRAEEERERERRAAEEQRRRLEQLTVRTVETRSYLVNFVPFGAGQFQQGRTRLGVMLAAGEGLLAVTSIIAYLAYNGLITERVTVVDDRPLDEGGQYTFVERGIRSDRRREATVWRNIKYISGGGFWLLYGFGVVDALYHHQDQVELISTPAPEPRAPPTPQTPGNPSSSLDLPSSAKPQVSSKLDARLSLFPVPGGMGGGLTLTF